MNFRKQKVFFILLTSIFLSYSSAVAQQTIINVPSSELLPAGSIILKQSNRVRPFADTFDANLTPSMTMGIGRGMEISTGVATGIGENTIVRGDFSAKKVFFLGSSARLTLGGTISPYLSQREHPDSLMYAHITQRIKQTKTSVTAGAYLGGLKGAPDIGGAIVGLEQVIIPNKLRLAIDWMSGQESLGRLGVGIKYRPHPTVSITSSVIIPNKESDNIAFNISVSKFISLDDENPIKRRLTNVD